MKHIEHIRVLWLTCSLTLRLAALPLGLASFAGGDQDAGRGGHHQPMATCSACIVNDAVHPQMLRASDHVATIRSSLENLAVSQDVYPFQHGRGSGAAQGRRDQQRIQEGMRWTHVTASRAAHACGSLEGSQGIAEDSEGRPCQRQARGHDRHTIDCQEVGGIPDTCTSSAQPSLFYDSCELLVYGCAYSSLQRARLAFLHKQCVIQYSTKLWPSSQPVPDTAAPARQGVQRPDLPQGSLMGACEHSPPGTGDHQEAGCDAGQPKVGRAARARARHQQLPPCSRHLSDLRWQCCLAAICARTPQRLGAHALGASRADVQGGRTAQGGLCTGKGSTHPICCCFHLHIPMYSLPNHLDSPSETSLPIITCTESEAVLHIM